MSTLPRPDRVLLAFGAAGLAVGAVLGLLALIFSPGTAAAPVAPLPALRETDGAGPPPVAAAPGEADRRPLFVSSRRAEAAAANDRTSASVPAPDLLVTGIIWGPQGGIAAGTDRRNTTVFSLKAGDIIGDWQVRLVSKDHLYLQHDGQDRDYPLTLPAPPPFYPSPGKDALQP